VTLKNWENDKKQNLIKYKAMDNNNEVKIVEYDPKYKEAFRHLNEEWISTFFQNGSKRL
jgi:hypothetical protein